MTAQEVVSEIQKGIYLARQELADDQALPKLDHVDLRLNTVVTVSRETGFKFLIFSFGKKWETETVQKLSLTPRPVTTAGLAPPVKGGISKQIAEAIVGAAVGVGAASSDAQVPLELQKLSVELGFVVRTEGGSGIGTKFSVEPLTLEWKGVGSVENEAIQKLTVVFEKT